MHYIVYTDSTEHHPMHYTIYFYSTEHYTMHYTAPVGQALQSTSSHRLEAIPGLGMLFNIKPQNI